MLWGILSGRIDPYFDSVICGDMVKKAKPDPEIYQKASESLGIPPEYCMAFEDAPGGILSAHQAGMKVIMVRILYSRRRRYGNLRTGSAIRWQM